MRITLLLAVAITAGSIPTQTGARVGIENPSAVTGGASAELPPYLQCVPYARQVTGIQIYGDAWTWWNQADGRYARGDRPKVGAVMALRPHGNSRLGHVAAVSRIIDSRTILIRHANWSPINGRRGQIEDNVRVVDASENNDWSQVRIWYAPIGALGDARWPVQGFIYRAKPSRSEALSRPAPPKPAAAAQTKAKSRSHDPIGAIIGQRMGW